MVSAGSEEIQYRAVWPRLSQIADMVHDDQRSARRNLQEFCGQYRQNFGRVVGDGGAFNRMNLQLLIIYIGYIGLNIGSEPGQETGSDVQVDGSHLLNQTWRILTRVALREAEVRARLEPSEPGNQASKAWV